MKTFDRLRAVTWVLRDFKGPDGQLPDISMKWGLQAGKEEGAISTRLSLPSPGPASGFPEQPPAGPYNPSLASSSSKDFCFLVKEVGMSTMMRTY